MISVQKPLDLNFSSSYTVGFVPVNFCQPNATTWQTNFRHALQFTPVPDSVVPPQPDHITNASACGDDLNIGDGTEYLDHYPKSSEYRVLACRLTSYCSETIPDL